MTKSTINRIVTLNTGNESIPFRFSNKIQLSQLDFQLTVLMIAIQSEEKHTNTFNQMDSIQDISLVF